MLAEREVLRMLNRKANSGREDMSTGKLFEFFPCRLEKLTFFYSACST